MTAPANRKYEKLLSLSTHVIRRDVLFGHLKWKVTELSRASGTARSVIYESLGKNKKSILLNALKLLLAELYGLSDERRDLHTKVRRIDALLRSRDLVMRSPELLSFYYRHRARTDEIGQTIRDYESRYLAAVAEQAGLTDPAHVLFMRTVIHGVSVAPFLSDDQVRECMGTLASLLKSSVPISQSQNVK